MRKIIILLGLVILFTAADIQAAQASESSALSLSGACDEECGTVTFEELNDDSVFIKQSRHGTCTLASAAMILRREAMLSGDDEWDMITESSLRGSAWLNGDGLLHDFSYGEINMKYMTVSSVSELKGLLEEHPEGIVAYDRSRQHAVALTDYDEETDIFYCSDPAGCCPLGRIPVSESLISVKNVRSVWYVANSLPVTAAADDEEFDENFWEEVM